MSNEKRVINFKYNFGDIVYLIHDPDQVERMVTSYMVKPLGVLYGLSVGELESYHYDFEIASDKNQRILYNLN